MTWGEAVISVLLAIIALVEIRNTVLLNEKRSAWHETIALLKLVKGYFEQARREHTEATSVIGPAVNAAVENTEQTRSAVMDSVVPSAAEIRATVVKEVKPIIEGLNAYAHKSTHEERNYWQTLFLRTEIIADKLGIKLPPVKVKEAKA